MPAHLRSIVRPCGIRGCGRPASHALHNTWNAIVNNYCDRHAQDALDNFRQRYEGGK